MPIAITVVIIRTIISDTAVMTDIVIALVDALRLYWQSQQY